MGISTFPASSGGGGASKIQKVEVINSTQSWTAPADVTQVELIIVAGGGGGGRGGSTSWTGCGGSGSLLQRWVTVTPGASTTVSIGAGGSAAPQSGSAGVDGSNTSFGSTVCPGGFGNYDAPQNQRGGQGGGGSGGAVANTSDSTAVAIIAQKGTFGLAGGGGAYKSAGNYGVGGTDGGGGFYGYSNNQPGQVNSGGGGGGSDNGGAAKAGGSGVCIIKYWSAL